MTFLADAHRAHLLIGAHRAALVANTCRLAALGADQHSVGDMDRHSLLDNASLCCPVLRAYMLLDEVEPLNDDLVHLWHRPRDHALLPSILAGQNNDGIAFLNIHLGKVERSLLFLFYCHIFPLQGFLERFAPTLQYLWRKRDDFHEVALAQFTGYRAKDTCTSRVVAGRDNDGCVFVKADMRAVGAHIFLCHTHDDGVDHFALLHLPVGRGLLNRRLDDVAHFRIFLARATHHANTHNLFCAGVIRDLQTCLWLNHCYSSPSSSSASAAPAARSGSTSANNSSTGTMPLPRLTIWTRRQCFVLLIGRLSSMRTVSPICPSLFSSCTWNFLVTL